ncbi:unnamed protein product [Closterium sp. NIES-53]
MKKSEKQFANRQQRDHSVVVGDQSVSFYARYPHRGLPIPPPPQFLNPTPPPAPAPPVHPPYPGPSPSDVAHSAPLPLVTRQVFSPSPQSSSQSPQQPSALPWPVVVDSWGVGARGSGAGGATSKDKKFELSRVQIEE